MHCYTMDLVFGLIDTLLRAHGSILFFFPEVEYSNGYF